MNMLCALVSSLHNFCESNYCILLYTCALTCVQANSAERPVLRSCCGVCVVMCIYLCANICTLSLGLPAIYRSREYSRHHRQYFSHCKKAVSFERLPLTFQSIRTHFSYSAHVVFCVLKSCRANAYLIAMMSCSTWRTAYTARPCSAAISHVYCMLKI